MFHLWMMGPDGQWRYLGAMGGTQFTRTLKINFAANQAFFALAA